MIQYNMLFLPCFFLLTAFLFVLLGYLMGRKTKTDAPIWEKKFNPDDGKAPEQDEIRECLYGDKK